MIGAFEASLTFGRTLTNAHVKSFYSAIIRPIAFVQFHSARTVFLFRAFAENNTCQAATTLFGLRECIEEAACRDVCCSGFSSGLSPTKTESIPRFLVPLRTKVIINLRFFLAPSGRCASRRSPVLQSRTARHSPSIVATIMPCGIV